MITNRWLVLLVFVVLAGMVGVVWTLQPAGSLVVAGVFVVAFLPGFLLSATLFTEVRGSFHIALALSLSVVWLQIGGVILNWFRIQLTPDVWIMWMVGSLALFGGTALWRRRDMQTEIFTVDLTSLPRFITTIILLVTAALIVFGAYQVALEGERLTVGSEFTQLWSRYTESGALEIHVTSAELAPRRFRLFVIANGREQATYEFVLQPGESWTDTINRRITGRVDVQLYRADRPASAYRTNRLPAPVMLP